MPLSEVLRSNPALAVVLLFGAGVVTSFFPCIYPMIPITVSVIGGSAGSGASRRRLIGLTLTYVLGLSLLYATMGLVAGLTGSLFGTIGANPWVRFATANLLLLFALALLDVLPLAAPARLAAWAGQLSGGSYGAVLLLGATSGIVAAPCGAPAFAAVLTWVAATHSAVLGFVYLFAFSLGMSVLLAGVGVFSGAAARLPRPGVWMAWVKRVSGVILIAVAEYYFVQVGKSL
jgi:thiol:disulfide interchange protein DsbD